MTPEPACAIDVEVSLAFGDGTTKWPITPADFRLVALDEETCVGAFFQLPPGTTGPDWIVGDTFLVRFRPICHLPLSSSSFGMSC